MDFCGKSSWCQTHYHPPSARRRVQGVGHSHKIHNGSTNCKIFAKFTTDNFVSRMPCFDMQAMCCSPGDAGFHAIHRGIMTPLVPAHSFNHPLVVNETITRHLHPAIMLYSPPRVRTLYERLRTLSANARSAWTSRSERLSAANGAPVADWHVWSWRTQSPQRVAAPNKADDIHRRSGDRIMIIEFRAPALLLNVP